MNMDLVKVEDNMPWSTWHEASAVEADLSGIGFGVIDSEMHGIDNVGAKLGVYAGGDLVGIPTKDALQDLNKLIQFPTDFIEKLPYDLQAQVINARLAATDRQPKLNLVREPWLIAQGGQMVEHDDMPIITNFAPGWRDVTPHAYVAQTAFDVLASVYDREQLEIRHARRATSGMEVRIITPQDAEVAKGGRKVGDVLRFGVDVRHKYGMELYVKLFVERLVCLNGMTAAATQFEWKARTMGTIEMQLQFVMIGIAEALGSFDPLVSKAREMSDTPIEGDPEVTLIERARAMHLPSRYDTQLIEAWRREPVPTEWGMLNAFTNWATHSEAPQQIRMQTAAAAGRWAEGFDMVTARLPRTIAEAVGAHVVEDVELVPA